MKSCGGGARVLDRLKEGSGAHLLRCCRAFRLEQMLMEVQCYVFSQRCRSCSEPVTRGPEWGRWNVNSRDRSLMVCGTRLVLQHITEAGVHAIIMVFNAETVWCKQGVEMSLGCFRRVGR